MHRRLLANNGRTLMRTPVVKRQTSPTSGWFALFRVESLVQFSAGHMFWREVSGLAQRSCGCPTHVWRVYRHGDGKCRAPRAGFLRPRTISGPSCRPPPRRGSTCACARELQARVRGSPPSPSETCACWIGARAGVPSHAQGRGPVPMGSCGFVDAIGAAWQSTVARRAHRDPVRPTARRLPARHAGARGRDRTPRRVSPEPRRLGPASAPRPLRPCPGRVLSRSGPDMLGPQACCGGLRPPLRSRPTCETPGRSSCRRCHHASPPLPWRMCPGGSRPHKPGPAGSG
jgi:hypothetical protein